MQIVKNEFSLLQQPWSAPSRPLWKALAHTIANAKPGSERAHLLNRLYIGELSNAEKLCCIAEIHECRAAKRGARLAVVA